MGRAEGRASVPRVGAGNRGSSAKRPQERRGLVSLLTVTMAAPSWVPTVYSLEAEACLALASPGPSRWLLAGGLPAGKWWP